MIQITIECKEKTIQIICILAYSTIIIDKIIGLLKYLHNQRKNEKVGKNNGS